MTSRQVLVTGITLGLLITASFVGDAQESAETRLPEYLRVCSAENLPPCATPPPVTHQAAPEYSPEARAAKIQGSVFLEAVIGLDGRAHHIRTVRSLGHGLDEKAIQALEHWKFTPGKSGGKKVPVLITVEVRFGLFQ